MSFLHLTVFSIIPGILTISSLDDVICELGISIELKIINITFSASI